MMGIKPRYKWMGAAFIVVVLAGFTGLNYLAYNHAYAMMFFVDGGTRTTSPEAMTLLEKMKVLVSGVKVPRPESAVSMYDFDPDCKTMTIEAGDFVNLEAWYSFQGNETPLVILLHGYAAEKSSLLNEARVFRDLGASVLLVDFRGSGGSSRSYTTIGIEEAIDVADVVRFTEGHLPHDQVILYGQSMGAAAVLRAVSRFNTHPDGIILEAVFDALLNTVRNRFRAMGVPSFPSAELLLFWGGRQFRMDAFNHNPEEYAAAVRCPVLFLHGDQDPRATIFEARHVYDHMNSPKKFVTFDHCGHKPCLNADPSKWRAEVTTFLRGITD